MDNNTLILLGLVALVVVIALVALVTRRRKSAALEAGAYLPPGV